MRLALKVHFIGIGGTGMGALAGLLAEAGHDVRGSDTALYPPMSTQLAAARIPVFDGFAPENLDWGPDCVVVGNVCSAGHPEVRAARERRIPLESFPSLLRRTLLAEREPLVVAGTHGKTTTASALAWILDVAERSPSFLIGGVPVNFGRGYRLGKGRAFVLEGDEYDTAFFDKGSKFLHYRPRHAILHAVEFDHADIFSDMEKVRRAFRGFVDLLPEDGTLVVFADDPEAMGCAASCRGRVVTFAVGDGPGDRDRADYVAVEDASGSLRRPRFTIYARGQSLGTFSTQLVGRHNRANLLAAVALAHTLGVSPEVLRDAVRTFRGVRRRQELLGVAQGVRVIDDFAHHPTAVSMTVAALRRRYPDHALHVCFEPRSASSRRKVFASAYARAFDAATSVRIGPLFRPEKVPPSERLDPVALAAAVSERGVPARAFADTDTLLDDLADAVAPGDTVVVLSSGRFDDLGRRLLARLGDAVVFAEPEDHPQVDALLAGYGLPPVDRSRPVDTLVIRNEGHVVACVSLEVAGDEAFLFGLAVDPARRGEGLGWVLGDCIMRHARTLGVERVYLITATAADFFGRKLGFSQVDVAALGSAMAERPNLRAYAAIEGAVCMAFSIPPDGPVTPGRA